MTSGFFVNFWLGPQLQLVIEVRRVVIFVTTIMWKANCWLRFRKIPERKHGSDRVHQADDFKRRLIRRASSLSIRRITNSRTLVLLKSKRVARWSIDQRAIFRFVSAIVNDPAIAPVTRIRENLCLELVFRQCHATNLPMGREWVGSCHGDSSRRYRPKGCPVTHR